LDKGCSYANRHHLADRAILQIGIRPYQWSAYLLPIDSHKKLIALPHILSHACTESHNLRSYSWAMDYPDQCKSESSDYHNLRTPHDEHDEHDETGTPVTPLFRNPSILAAIRKKTVPVCVAYPAMKARMTWNPESPECKRPSWLARKRLLQSAVAWR
jgi:hypothetical protein